jgi:PAS domain S-box-containing protein
MQTGDALTGALIEAAAAEVAVLDAAGNIVAVNTAWQRFARANGALPTVQVGAGLNYLAVCERATKAGDPLAAQALEGVRAVLSGARSEFELEYPCHAPSQPRWYRMRAARAGTGAVVSHTDITHQRIGRAHSEPGDVLLRGFYDSSPLLMGVAELDGERIVAVDGNTVTARFFGRSPDDLAGHSGAALGVPQAVSDVWLAQYRRCAASRLPVEFEYEHPLPEGSCWLKASVAWLGTSPEGRPRFSFVCEDVTERKRIERALRDSEAQLRVALRSAQLGIYEWEPATGRLQWDARVRELWDLPQGAAVDYATFRAGLHCDDVQRVDAAVSAALQPGRDGTFECEYRVVSPRSSAERWVKATGQVTFEGGRAVRMVGTVQDITAWKQVEASLQQRSERLAVLLDAASALLGADDPVAYLDLLYRRLAGVLELDLYLHFQVAPAEPTLVLAACHGITEAQQARLTPLRLGDAVCGRVALERRAAVLADVQASGEERSARVRATGVQAYACHPLVAHGELLGTLSFGSRRRSSFGADEVALMRAVCDLVATALGRRRAERALRQREQDLATAFRVNPQPMFIVRASDQRYVEVNEPWERLTGYSRGEAIGRTSAELGLYAEGEDRARFYQALRGHSAARDFEFDTRNRQGQLRRVAVSAELADIGGEALIIGAVNDVTARREIELERAALLQAEREARRAAEHANRAKDEFLATVSHELRTPLNAMLGWSHILARRSGEPALLQEGLAVIERNARAQAQLIADLLDMSRIVSGRLRLEMESVDLQDVVRAAVDTVGPAARAKDIRIEVALEPRLGRVQGDPQRLQQVAWNLLSNAVKFTPPRGRVEVALARDGGHAQLRVRDSGQGIDPALLPHVFDRFRQADSSTTRRHGGLGLGLAIVKQLVELHGGEVQAHSAGPGQGASFVIRLPLLQAEASAPTAVAAPLRSPRAGRVSLAGVTVLAVDDEADGLSMVRQLLEEHDARVLTASSAREALRVIGEVQPDILLSDIGMPEMDGYELIHHVRSAMRGAALPAVAVTAFARAEDQLRALRAGYQAHIAKPLEPDELLDIVAMLAGRLRVTP